MLLRDQVNRLLQRMVDNFKKVELCDTQSPVSNNDLMNLKDGLKTYPRPCSIVTELKTT